MEIPNYSEPMGHRICTSRLRTVYLLAVAMCVLVTLLRNAFLAPNSVYQCLPVASTRLC